MQCSPRWFVTVIAAALFLVPGVATAQSGGGVTFDDGPSSKEYAIPLDAARGATKTKAPAPNAKTTPAPAPAPAAPPAATTPPAAAAAAATNKPEAKPKSKSEPDTTTQAAAPTTTTPPSDAAAPVSTPASSEGTGAGLVIGGLALAAIMLGGLAGLVLRKRRRPVDEL